MKFPAIKIGSTINDALPALTFSYILLLVAPLTFYFQNYQEYQIGALNLTGRLAALTVTCAIILFFINRTLVRFPKVQFAFYVLLSGGATLMWLQSQVLVWDLGFLDGRGVNWEKWRIYGLLEILAWVGFIVFTWLIGRRNRKFLPRVQKTVLILGTFSLVINIPSPSSLEETVRQNHTDKNLFSFSSTKENKIILILDTFQSDIFDEIRIRWPEEVAFLEGFEYFPDTLGGYPTTQASVPLILSGTYYRNEKPVRAWVRKNYREFNLPEALGERGYHPSLISITPSTLDGIRAPITSVSFAVDSFGSMRQEVLFALDAGLFRSFPIFVKSRIYDEGNWFFSRYLKIPSKYTTQIPGRHGGDYSFTLAFEDFANAHMENNSATFKYFHLNGAHWPLQINENYDHVQYAGRTGRAEYIAQSRGTLLLARRFIETLKKIGVYKHSEILIASDHGSRRIPANDIIVDAPNKDLGPAPVTTLASSRPLFLYKAKGRGGPLTENNHPMSLSLVACIFRSVLDQCIQDSPSERFFYYYDWSKEYQDWSREYMPPMLKFSVEGDSRRVSSWTNEKKTFQQGAVSSYQPGGRISSRTTIDFSSDGNAAMYLGPGWSGQSKDSIWTNALTSLGGTSYLYFQTDDSATNSLRMTIKARGIYPPEYEYQHLEVRVGDTLIGELEIANKVSSYTLTLPEEILALKDFALELLVRNPVKPCEIRDTTDCRELGVNFFNISFE